VSFNPFRADVT